jgi:hypothetical protein
VPPVPAIATAHLGVFAAALVCAFVVGITGHIIRSRPLIVFAIVVIALISVYFVEVGEVSTFGR